MTNISGTSTEYPVVADVDKDGQAEIIIVGALEGTKSAFGRLCIYKSSDPKTSPWAPARKVWNQYAYHPLYVNEDLSIPTHPLSPATFFPGEGGVTGDGNDIQPYNNYLQQQTTLTQDGLPFWLAADAQIADTPAPSYNYFAGGDSMLVTLTVENIGAAGLQANFYIAAYKDDATDAANSIAVDSSLTTLNSGLSQTVVLTIRNFSTRQPFDALILRVNDRGNASYVQAECDTDNNSVTVPFADLLLAHNDRATTVAGIPVLIAPLANDSIPFGCRPSEYSVEDHPKHGDFTDSRYTPAPSFTGYDTIRYFIECLGSVSTACIYIYVAAAPDNVVTEDCTLPAPASPWSINQNPTRLGDNNVSTFQTTYVGDLNGDERPEIVVARSYTGKDEAPWCYYTEGIHVFDLKNNTSKLFTTAGYATGGVGQIGLARPNDDPSSKSKGYIVIAAMDGYLYAYDMEGNTMWTGTNNHSDVPYTTYDVPDNCTGSGYKTASIMFSDFDGDGNTEIVTGDRIFDLET